jgi:hypothetical protein
LKFCCRSFSHSQPHQTTGDRWVKLGAGDLLIVDNLKLHTVIDAPGLNARVISIGFLPEFVYSLGSPSYDYYSLLPFLTHQAGERHVVRTDAPLYPTMVSTVADLLTAVQNNR